MHEFEDEFFCIIRTTRDRLTTEHSKMSEKKKIHAAVKLRMRHDGITYAKLSKKLGVSEITVKRYFSEERLTLDTLDQICAALKTSLDELMADFKAESQTQKERFTREQETALANNEFLFVLFYIVARKFSYGDILKKLSRHNPAKIIRGLRELEELSLIDFSSENKLKSLVSSNAAIQPGGPLWNQYSSVAIREFFESDFSGKNEYFDLSIGYLSHAGQSRVRDLIEKVQKEIHALLQVDGSTRGARDEGDFLWIASCYRPVGFSMLEVIAEKSKYLSNKKS